MDELKFLFLKKKVHGKKLAEEVKNLPLEKFEKRLQVHFYTS